MSKKKRAEVKNLTAYFEGRSVIRLANNTIAHTSTRQKGLVVPFCALLVKAGYSLDTTLTILRQDDHGLTKCFRPRTLGAWLSQD